MTTFKHLLALLILSIAFVFAFQFAHLGAQWLAYIHVWIADQFKTFFTPGQTGDMARELIALLLLPLVAGLIPGIIYWLIRRQWLPAFLAIVWTVWLLQVGVLAMAGRNVPNTPPKSTIKTSAPVSTAEPETTTTEETTTESTTTP